MNLRFRPLLGFSLLCGCLFAALMALGFWQLERLQWKLGLIAEIHRNLAGPAISLDRVLALGTSRAQYRRVALDGRFETAKEVYVYTTGPHGVPVYHVLCPLVLSDRRTVMVDRGFVPLALRNPATRPLGEYAAIRHVVGVWRTPDRPGPFTPAPDLAHRVWFARDLENIAKVENLRLSTHAIVEADGTPNPGGWPKGGQTAIDLPNDHLQYAITWFLLALGLVIVYFAYHRARGRLVFDADRQ